MNIITPIEQFRQLKEILHRQPAQVIIVGIDVAKFNSITCIADGQKTIINKKMNIPTVNLFFIFFVLNRQEAGHFSDYIDQLGICRNHNLGIILQ